MNLLDLNKALGKEERLFKQSIVEQSKEYESKIVPLHNKRNSLKLAFVDKMSARSSKAPSNFEWKHDRVVVSWDDPCLCIHFDYKDL